MSKEDLKRFLPSPVEGETDRDPGVSKEDLKHFLPSNDAGVSKEDLRI